MVTGLFVLQGVQNWTLEQILRRMVRWCLCVWLNELTIPGYCGTYPRPPLNPVAITICLTLNIRSVPSGFLTVTVHPLVEGSWAALTAVDDVHTFNSIDSA